MTETTTTETKLSRPRKAAVAAVLVAGLSGAFAIVGISTASSDPGNEPRVTEMESHSPMDVGDRADCERFSEEQGMSDHSDFDHEEMGDMMGAGDRMGAAHGMGA